MKKRHSNIRGKEKLINGYHENGAIHNESNHSCRRDGDNDFRGIAPAANVYEYQARFEAFCLESSSLFYLTFDYHGNLHNYT